MGINGSRRQNNHIKKNLRWTDLGGGYIYRYTPRRYAPAYSYNAQQSVWLAAPPLARPPANPYSPNVCWYSVHLPTQGWPGWVERWLHTRMVTHLSANRARRRATCHHWSLNGHFSPSFHNNYQNFKFCYASAGGSCVWSAGASGPQERSTTVSAWACFKPHQQTSWAAEAATVQLSTDSGGILRRSQPLHENWTCRKVGLLLNVATSQLPFTF